MTGLATPLRLLRLWNNKHDFISNVAPSKHECLYSLFWSFHFLVVHSITLRTNQVLPILDVRYGFHAVAIHDPRAPYSATLMRGSDVHQVAFTGKLIYI